MTARACPDIYSVMISNTIESNFFQSQDVAKRNPPRGQFETPASLRQRVRVPLQSPPHTDGCIPVTAGSYDTARADHPQDVVYD